MTAASKARARFGSAGRTSLSSRIADDDDDHYGAVEEAVHREAPAAPAHTKATPLRPNSVNMFACF